MPEAQPILIAYDGSDAARAAVNEAAALFGSRPAIVVTVWEPGLADYMLMPNTMGTGTMMMPYDPATVQAIDKASEDHARDIAEDGAQLARASACRPRRSRCATRPTSPTRSSTRPPSTGRPRS
jgi:nucleotide-binding universal stress UspA family protein